VGTARDDLLAGRAGDDRLNGLSGDETLRGETVGIRFWPATAKGTTSSAAPARTTNRQRDHFDVVSEDCERKFDQTIN
jgi:hypothetical protein